VVAMAGGRVSRTMDGAARMGGRGGERGPAAGMAPGRARSWRLDPGFAIRGYRGALTAHTVTLLGASMTQQIRRCINRPLRDRW
jgi:hypothetical protein